MKRHEGIFLCLSSFYDTMVREDAFFLKKKTKKKTLNTKVSLSYLCVTICSNPKDEKRSHVPGAGDSNTGKKDEWCRFHRTSNLELNVFGLDTQA